MLTNGGAGSNLRYILSEGYSFLRMDGNNRLFRSVTEEYGIGEICRAKNRVVNFIYVIKTTGMVFGSELHIYLFYNKREAFQKYL